jgi:hypothetical protein
MSAFQKKDWKTVYNLMELPPEQKSQLTEAMFSQVMQMVGNMVTLKSYKIGEVENKGDTATVKVTATASTPALMGQPAGDKTGTNDIPLKLVDGKWKIDISAARGGMPGLGGIGSLGGR